MSLSSDVRSYRPVCFLPPRLEKESGPSGKAPAMPQHDGHSAAEEEQQHQQQVVEEEGRKHHQQHAEAKAVQHQHGAEEQQGEREHKPAAEKAKRQPAQR